MKMRFVWALLVSALAACSLSAAEPARRGELPDDLAAVPGDAIGFAHIRVAEVWKSDVMKEMRETVLRAGAKALEGFDKRFVPNPSTIDRLTLVVVPRNGDIDEKPEFYAILRFTKAFDKDEFLKSAMPNAVEKKTTNGSYWVDAKSATAAALIKDQIIVFGTVPGVEIYIDKRSAGPGALTTALHAVDPKRHVTVAGNLTLIPPEAMKEVPPPAVPLLHAKTATLTFDLAENAQVDLSLNFADERAAAQGLVAVQDLAKMGRGFIKKSREEMLNTVLGDGKVAPLEKLPESAMALVALGGMDRLDAFLASPPVKQDGATVKASITMPNMSYAALAPIGVGLLLPAVQKVRSAAAHVQSMNNLKQMGIAMHNYHDAFGHFPGAAICDKNGKALLSWRVSILPYIEENNLYQQFKLDEPWDSENNKKLIPLMPKIYLDPQAPNPQPGITHYRVFWGEDTALDLRKSRSIAGITDGTSNTGLIFEMEDGAIWTKPDDFAYDKKKPLPKFASFRDSGFLVCFADGSVRSLPAKFPEKTMRHVIEAADGEVIEFP